MRLQPAKVRSAHLLARALRFFDGGVRGLLQHNHHVALRYVR